MKKRTKTLSLALAVMLVAGFMLTGAAGATVAPPVDPEAYLMTSFRRQTEGAGADQTMKSLDGVAIQFEGNQGEIAFEELSDFVVTVDGEAADVAFAEAVERTEIKETEEVDQTHYIVAFETPFVEAGVYTFTCKFGELLIDAGTFTWNEDGTFAWASAEDPGEPVPSEPDIVWPDAATAIPTNDKVTINGEEVAFDAYKIEGSNFFKLRDVAFAINGTEKQFAVGYDEATKGIALTSGEAYEEVGGEMESKGEGDKDAVTSPSVITLDGEEIALVAYNIGGNNYFRLRDIGEAFDFNVSFDETTRTVVINTAEGYTAD
ncbi:copper amine oxidase N-terminal domain-containing protein [Oscillospiraceae bacterium OttesenSCG-928-F05]|nr:copper amine oxidase N-terminal domain-containing protein [Oscillospiraceae bacterium OttesenSCG-928-F05]